MTDKRLIIVVGHYGSGKTEFSVNLAIDLKKRHEKVSISDLDIVNTYFRTRERKKMLTDMGIQVIDSNVEASALDLPALPAEIMGAVQNKSYVSILDVGGNSVGARVLARFSKSIKSAEYELLFVVNANRPETSSVDSVISFIRSVEDMSELKVTGLVNTTHLLKDTSVQDIVNGHKLVKDVSSVTEIPIVYEVALENIASEIKLKEIKDKLFPIKMYMREDWMS